MTNSIRDLYRSLETSPEPDQVTLDKTYFKYLEAIRAYNDLVKPNSDDFFVYPLERQAFGIFLKGPSHGYPEKYFSLTEQANHEVVIKNGKLFFHGQLLDTRDATESTRIDSESPLIKTTTGKAIFVMDGLGRIFLTKHSEEGHIHHSSLVAGQPVAASGWIVAQNGKLMDLQEHMLQENVSDGSGHYAQPAPALAQFINLLFKNGVADDASQVRIDRQGHLLSLIKPNDLSKIRQLRMAGVPYDMLTDSTTLGRHPTLVDFFLKLELRSGDSVFHSIEKAFQNSNESADLLGFILLHFEAFEPYEGSHFSTEGEKLIALLWNQFRLLPERTKRKIEDQRRVEIRLFHLIFLRGSTEMMEWALVNLKDAQQINELKFKLAAIVDCFRILLFRGNSTDAFLVDRISFIQAQVLNLRPDEIDRRGKQQRVVVEAKQKLREILAVATNLHQRRRSLCSEAS